MFEEERGRVNQNRLINSNINQINIIHDVCKSICKIFTGESYGSGFFMKLMKGDEDFYCLLSCEHVITKKIIEFNKEIEVFYENQHKQFKINFNEDTRYIRDYKYINIDAIVIEILEKDEINKEYFLLPNYEYKNGYIIFKDKKINILQYPLGKELSISYGNIKNIHMALVIYAVQNLDLLEALFLLREFLM